MCVARGSIAYSAVSQPSPFPRFHPGTPSSTLAAPRSSVTLRIASSARPARAGRSAGAGTELLDDRGGGLSGRERHDHDAPAPGLDFAAPDDSLGRVVAALHDHVGARGVDQLERRVLI